MSWLVLPLLIVSQAAFAVNCKDLGSSGLNFSDPRIATVALPEGVLDLVAPAEGIYYPPAEYLLRLGRISPELYQDLKSSNKVPAMELVIFKSRMRELAKENARYDDPNAVQNSLKQRREFDLQSVREFPDYFIARIQPKVRLESLSTLLTAYVLSPFAITAGTPLTRNSVMPLPSSEAQILAPKGTHSFDFNREKWAALAVYGRVSYAAAEQAIKWDGKEPFKLQLFVLKKDLEAFHLKDPKRFKGTAEDILRLSRYMSIPIKNLTESKDDFQFEMPINSAVDLGNALNIIDISVLRIYAVLKSQRGFYDISPVHIDAW